MPRKRVIVYLEDSTIEVLKTLGKGLDQNLSGVIRSIIAERLHLGPLRNIGRPTLDAGPAIPLDAKVGREAHRPDRLESL